MALKEPLLLQLIYEITRHIRAAMDHRLRPLGLSQAKWRALIIISSAKESPTQTELASLIGIEPPTLARLLDRLEKDGWIERAPATTDRRAKTVHLTSKAAETIRHIRKTASEIQSEALVGVPPETVRFMLDFLVNLRDRAATMHLAHPTSNSPLKMADPT